MAPLVSEVLADGDRAALDGAFDANEPVPSGFYDDEEAAAEARGYERGYRQAVKEQYWLIQNQQRRPAPAEPNPAHP